MIINLTKENKIRSLRDKRLESIDVCNYKIHINDKDVFIKKISKKGMNAELIALEILDLLNIPRVKTGLGIIKRKKYFISYASYEKPEEFISGDKLLNEFYNDNREFIKENPEFYGNPDISIDHLNSFHVIWQAIEWYIKKYNIKKATPEEILKALIMQFLISYISGLEDMHSVNWALLHQGDELGLYPRYDNDNFERFFPHTKIKWSDTLTVYYSNYFKDMDKILIEFLTCSEDYYREIALDMANKILIMGMDNIINIVESKWSISIKRKEEFAKRYTDRLMYICEIIDSIKNKDSKITVHR